MRRQSYGTVILLLAAFGCSGKSTSSGSGGTTASGGSTSTGGTVATGGAAGAAGASGAGGASGPPVCAEYQPHPNSDTCRTQSDCTNGGMCFPWNYDPPCPYPPQCYGDSSCSADMVCVDTGCNMGCAPKCTATSCSGDTAVCGADGHCQPTPCGSGYDCGPGADCDPTALAADAHGCRPHSCSTDGHACPPNSRCEATNPDAHGCSVLPCSTDTDCDCGVCWNGYCAAGPGYCGYMPG